MIVALEEAKYSLNEQRAKITELGSALRIDELREKAAELEKQTYAEDFWNDQENSSKILQQVKQLKDKIEAYEKLAQRLEDAITLAEMAIEENDETNEECLVLVVDEEIIDKVFDVYDKLVEDSE